MTRITVMCGFILAACARGEPAPADSAATAAQGLTSLAWALDAPAVWGDRIRLDDATVPGQHLSARFFNYLPRDTTVAPQAVLGIVVLDSAQWARARAADGPPAGDSLATVRGQVFLASLPQSNPFAQASADFRIFDSLTVTLEAVRRAFRVLP